MQAFPLVWYPVGLVWLEASRQTGWRCVQLL